MMPNWRTTSSTGSRGSGANGFSKAGPDRVTKTKQFCRRGLRASRGCTRNSKDHEISLQIRSSRKRRPGGSAASNLSRGLSILAKARLHQFWRADRPNRRDAYRIGRKKEMDQRGAIPSCTQVLHAPARPRGSTIGDLCRLAPARDLGWHGGRGFLCYPVNLYPLDAQLHLRGVWQPALDCRDLLRSKASRAGDRCCGGHPHRQPSIEKRSDVDAGGRSLYSHLFFPRSISVNHCQCCPHWIFWRQVGARQISCHPRPWESERRIGFGLCFGRARSCEAVLASCASGCPCLADLMVGAGPFVELLAGQQSHRGSGRDFLQQSCPGYFWRGLRSVALRGAASRPNASLAFRRSNAGWTRSSRNNPGSLDHGDAVRRFSRRLEPPRTVASPAGRHDWRLSDNVDDIHSLLSMDLFGRSLH